MFREVFTGREGGYRPPPGPARVLTGCLLTFDVCAGHMHGCSAVILGPAMFEGSALFTAVDFHQATIMVCRKTAAGSGLLEHSRNLRGTC